MCVLQRKASESRNPGYIANCFLDCKADIISSQDSSAPNFETMMSDITETLALLRLEQADPDQNLVLQEFPPIYFPKFDLLPPELRLHIWTDIFPAPRFFSFNEVFLRLRKRPLKIDTSPLTTLYINHKSREETLELYRLAMI
jgi:2EXR family